MFRGVGRYYPAVAADAVTPVEPVEDGVSGGPLIGARSGGLAAVRALLLGVAFIMSGNGLQGTVLGVRAELEGFGLGVTGLVMASYFLGFLFGTRAAEHFLVTVGHIRVFAALASTASSAAILHIVWIHPISWALLRFVFGVCIAGVFVTVESWLNDMATNAIRGRLLSMYMVFTMGGLGLGQILLNSAEPSGFKLFVVSSVLISMALVPVSLSASTAPPLSVPEPISLRTLIKIVPLGITTSFWVGVSHGALIGLGALYAAAEGLPSTRISLFLALPIAGSLVTQWFIGAASDRVPRRLVILVVAAAAAATAGMHIVVPPGSALSLGLMFIHGSATFPLYSLAVATTADSVQPSQLNGASASIVRVTGVGAVIGPVVGGAVMALTATWTFFLILASAHAMIVLYVMYRMVAHEAMPVDEQGRFSVWPARASAMAANLLRPRPRARARRH